MSLTLSAVIIGLLLLVGLPMVFISVNLQRQESARERQAQANQIARIVAAIIQSVQTGQTQLPATLMPNDPRVSFIAGQISNGLGLAETRVVSQIQIAAAGPSFLEDLLAQNAQIRGLALFDAAGRLTQTRWRTAAPPIETASFAQSNLIDLARQGFNAQDIQFIEGLNALTLLIAAPLPPSNKKVILAWVDVRSIWQDLTNLKVGETGYLYIIDHNGQPIMTPAAFVADEIPPQAAIKPGRAYWGLNGQRVSGWPAPIEGTSWQVVIEIPQAEANAGLRSLLIILGAILLFGLSLAISVARTFSRWLLQPIQTLHSSALKISRGDLSHQIKLERDDELGFLAGAFNQMVATLNNTINELRAVSLRLLSAEEAERQRIAREIHDELGQTLTALKFALLLAARKSADDENIRAAQKMATAAQEKARTLSHELRPAMLDDLGLKATLEWYVDRIEQRADLAISLEITIDEAALPSGIKTSLYRLVVEALTNIRKHAQAAAAEISLLQSGGLLHLTIADDGVGFNTETLRTTHSLGIAGMRERVNLLRGQFSIQSTVGAGAKIKITLPLF